MEGDWQRLTLLTPAPPPLSPFQMKKKPTTVAQRRSDCSVRQQAAKSVKSLKKTIYNALVRYNEEWPPLPAPSPLQPAHQGKKPVLLERRRNSVRKMVSFRIEVKKLFFEEMKQQERER